mmetsp:Transcript_23188/g.50901  ORF Transcript_23188/g.50901 Transcript_23188/m.50901 type:complete len:325 (+) Transcript_23188:139-1113(+)
MAPRTLKFASLSAAALALIFGQNADFSLAAKAPVNHDVEETCAADDDGCSRNAGKSKESVMLQTRRPGKMQLSKGTDIALEQADATAEKDNVQIKVASYNMFWWNVKMYNNWEGVFNRIRSNGPYDLFGFQECEDVVRTLTASGLITDFEYFQGISTENPAPIAWNKTVFEKISEPKSRNIGADKWGQRWVNSVKLRHKVSGATVLFLNTHGPLEQCGTESLKSNWQDSIITEKAGVDQVFMTGDFNCQIFETAMVGVRTELPRSADFYIDHILSTADVVNGERLEGAPSDHPFIRGTCSFAVTSKSTTKVPVAEEALVQAQKL